MTDYRNGDPVDILLVEDNPGDVRLTREAFEAGYINNTLHVATDGEEALEFLRQDGEYEDVPVPHLVLLDLNLPKIDGHDVLAEMKSDPALKRIPVVILTVSEDKADIRESYDLQASAYLTKPVSPEDFMELVQTFEEFWFTLVRLPPKPQPSAHD